MKDTDITRPHRRRPGRLQARRPDRHHVAHRGPRPQRQDPAVFEDTNAAKQALVNGQVDGIVADLPTAFYISAAEIKNSVIVGQFVNANAEPEQFGLLFQKGNPLVSCVNAALAAMTADGTLDQLQQQWLSDAVDVPVLQ